MDSGPCLYKVDVCRFATSGLRPDVGPQQCASSPAILSSEKVAAGANARAEAVTTRVGLPRDNRRTQPVQRQRRPRSPLRSSAPQRPSAPAPYPLPSAAAVAGHGSAAAWVQSRHGPGLRPAGVQPAEHGRHGDGANFTRFLSPGTPPSPSATPRLPRCPSSASAREPPRGSGRPPVSPASELEIPITCPLPPPARPLHAGSPELLRLRCGPVRLRQRQRHTARCVSPSPFPILFPTLFLHCWCLSLPNYRSFPVCCSYAS